MASLQQKGQRWYCQFLYQGKRHTFAVGDVSQTEAETKSAQVDYLLLRLKQRLVTVPAGMSIVDYVQFDGKPQQVPVTEKLTLGQLRDKYLAAHKEGLEETTLSGIRLHFRHLTRVIGEKFPIAELQLANLQDYVDKRAKASGLKGRKLSAATIKKELISLRTAWNWGIPTKLVAGPFPQAGLSYPKTTEKPPFMTRDEIERRIAAGGLTDAEISDLWDSLFLQTDEIAEFLQHIKARAIQPFVYPMACFAAYTGARRSELVRIRIADVDFKGKVVTIHEKKRVRGKSTTRRVPMSPFLIETLTVWLAEHPGGQYLFCQQSTVRRSKKRSQTTGHKGQARRATTVKGRAMTVTKREAHAATALTPDEARDHLDRTLADSKWSVLKGWHVARHSFISACASKGIDQRLVESWAGHMSKEMSRRYAHLYPSVQQEALARVFG